jgi:CubicO group peptidase (beta-lactamase class C family)
MSARASSRLAGLQFVNPQQPADGSPEWVHVLVPATAAAELPVDSEPLHVQVAGAGRMWSLTEWLEGTFSTSLVVLDHGRVVHEWYAEGLGRGDLLLGASMTKSALAHLVGVAVTDGVLTIADPVTEHVPELAGSGYDGTTVEHLLTMTTGVDSVEDHRDPTSFASRLLACFSEGTGNSRDLLRSVGRKAEPGTRYEYCTADSQVLDWVRERATGRPYAEALTALWATLGCEADALVSVDAPGGVALAGGGLAAAARDWARIGMLEVDGTHDGAAVLDAGWVERSAAPSQPFLAPGRLPSSITTHAGFGFHWWPLDVAGRHLTADGSRGQFVYVDRDEGVVVVKTSQWPYDDFLVDRQHRDLSYLGLVEVARAAVRSRAKSPQNPAPPHRKATT